MDNLQVWIDEGCIACGVCQSLCPQVFEVSYMAVVIPGVNKDKYQEQIQDAYESCPVEVIKVE